MLSPLGRNLRSEMDRLGIKYVDVAVACKVSEVTVGRWARGVNQPPWSSMLAMADLFDRPPAWFFDDHEVANAGA